MTNQFLSLISSSLFTSFLFVQLPVLSQNIDDLPNDSQAMKIWYCSQGNQAALVEVKAVKTWTEIIETQGWQCVERLATAPDNSPQFSCESNEAEIDLITVTWLQGENTQQQMKEWLNAFQNKQMTCTTDETNPIWN